MHTFVSFEVSHFGTSTNRGRFDKKEGTVQFDRAAKTGRVDINIDMNSINSGVAQFDSHLKSKDFFNAAEHPTARFVGDSFVFDGDKVTAVQGTLTMLGKSHPVTLKASQFNCYMNPMFKREVCGGDFEAFIQPTLWGINTYIPMVAPTRCAWWCRWKRSSSKGPRRSGRPKWQAPAGRPARRGLAWLASRGGGCRRRRVRTQARSGCKRAPESKHRVRRQRAHGPQHRHRGHQLAHRALIPHARPCPVVPAPGFAG
jgi:polyisoprenoid-binding protein YceI